MEYNGLNLFGLNNDAVPGGGACPDHPSFLLVAHAGDTGAQGIALALAQRISTS